MSLSWVMTIAAGVAIGYFAVQFIMKNLKNSGTVRNAEDAENAENTAESESAPQRRLHKSIRNKQIAGVCGGIAEYLNADPSLIRLATVLLIFGWGSGLLAYIVLALVLPEGE